MRVPKKAAAAGHAQGQTRATNHPKLIHYASTQKNCLTSPDAVTCFEFGSPARLSWLIELEAQRLADPLAGMRQNATCWWQPASLRCRELLLVLSTQPAASCHTHVPVGAGAYARHCPETTLLYRTIQEHWATLFTPHELIEKLIPLIPRPRCHLIRYHGNLGPAAKDRAKVVGTPVTPPAPNAAVTDKASEGESRDIDSTKLARPSRLPWAVLLKRVFMTNVLTCPECQGRMTILAAITNPEAIRKILDHLGISSEAPHGAGARPPPQADLSIAPDPSEVEHADPPSHDW